MTAKRCAAAGGRDGRRLGDQTGKKPIIGLSGGIGAGKSAVAKILAGLGAAVIDSDRMAHEELSHPDVSGVLRTWWGDQVFSAGGIPDRRAIAKIVFDHPAELGRLEGLLYPRLRRRRDELIQRYNADPKIRAIVLDAPKLYEAGLEDMCDVIVFVDAEAQARARRVAAERGWPEAELIRRENLQIPLDTKKANADYVVANHSSIDDLRPEIERILDSVLASFSK